jgi:GntR family transcriptional regulator, transcriptional repressor for pyruvate dehydrogenase complex
MRKTLGDSLPNLKSETIPASITKILGDYLLSGELKPGDKLPTETELAQKLGVGRNSVREAIKMLTAIGAVRSTRGSGVYITRAISASMLNPLIFGLVSEQGTSRELIQLRVLLDTGAAEMALAVMHDGLLDGLVEINRRLEEEGRSPDRDHHRLRDLDLAFHKELYRISGNSLLAKIGDAIYSLFLASIQQTVEAEPEIASKNHAMIIDALQTRNPDLVRASVRTSLAFWMRFVSEERDPQ